MKKKLLFMAILCVYSLTYSQTGPPGSEGNPFIPSDTCAGAGAMPSCGTEFEYTWYDTTTLTSEAGNSTNDAFFTISPAAIETIEINTCGSSSDRDTRIVVYSDCTFSTVIVESDTGGSGCSLNERVTFVADGVSTYIIMIEGGEQTPVGGAGFLKDGVFGMAITCTPGGILPPQAPQGITCNSSTSGSSVIFTDELDVQGSWTGDIGTTQVNGTTNTGEWEILPSGTSSSGNTGPSGPFSGTSYMNYEATAPGMGVHATATASAISSAIDLTGTIVEDAELTFYMHAYGEFMGTLDIGIGNSPSGPFTTEYSWSGEYQQNDTAPWYQVGVDLSSYLGQIIYIEFAHTGSGLGFEGDMSIDLVEVHACDTVLDVENEEDPMRGLVVYPNPIRDFLNMRALEHINEVSIYNLLGQQVKFAKPNSLQKSIDMSDLNSGIYIVKVKIGESVGTYKVIKE